MEEIIKHIPFCILCFWVGFSISSMKDKIKRMELEYLRKIVDLADCIDIYNERIRTLRNDMDRAIAHLNSKMEKIDDV